MKSGIRSRRFLQFSYSSEESVSVRFRGARGFLSMKVLFSKRPFPKGVLFVFSAVLLTKHFAFNIIQDHTKVKMPRNVFMQEIPKKNTPHPENFSLTKKPRTPEDLNVRGPFFSKEYALSRSASYLQMRILR